MKDGARCAELAVAHFCTGLVRSSEPLHRRLFDALSRANDEIYQEYKGAGGTTLSALVIDHSKAIGLVHVGDSRVYSISSVGQAVELRQLSRDDTLQVRLRELTNVPLHDLRHISAPESLAQFVGIGPNIRPQIVVGRELNEVKKFMVSTDGVHAAIEPNLGHLVAHAQSEKEIVQRAIVASRWFGGRDNATAVACTDISSATATPPVPEISLEVWDSFGKLDIRLDHAYVAEEPTRELLSEPIRGRTQKGRLQTARELLSKRTGNASRRKTPTEKRKGGKRTTSSQDSRQPQLDITITPGKKHPDED